MKYSPVASIFGRILNTKNTQKQIFIYLFAPVCLKSVNINNLHFFDHSV